MLRVPKPYPVAGSLQTVTARPADSLVDSIGICIHLTYNDTAYYDGARVVSYLTDLGIRNVRDSVSVNRPDVYPTAIAIANAGIGTNFLIGSASASDPVADVNAQLSALRDPNKYNSKMIVRSLEAPNEFDGFSGLAYPQWSDKLYAHEQAVYSVIKGDSVYGSLPYIGPSFGTYNGRVQYSNDSLYLNRTQYLDAGNLHSYPGGRTSESNIVSAISAMAGVSGSKPLYATETGFHTAVNVVNSANFGISERAQAIYLLRIFLEYFRLGVIRTFSYQLFDQKPNDTALKDMEEHFGIVAVEGDPTADRSTWILRKKPAFTALQKMIAVLSDTGSGTEPTSLNYLFSNAPAALRHLLLGRKDGSFDLVVWNAVSVHASSVYTPYSGYARQAPYTTVDSAQKSGVGDSHGVGYTYSAGTTAHDGDQDVEYAKYYDAHDGGDLYPSTSTVLLTIGSPFTAKVLRPCNDIAFMQLGRGNRFLIPVSSEPTIIRLLP